LCPQPETPVTARRNNPETSNRHGGGMLHREPGAGAGKPRNTSRPAFQVALVGHVAASDHHDATHPLAARLQVALTESCHDVVSYVVAPSIRPQPLRLADFVFVCADLPDRDSAVAFAHNLRGPDTVVIVLDRPRAGCSPDVFARRGVLKAVLDESGPVTRIVASPSRATACLYELLRSTAIDLVVAPELRAAS
jgi:hypothetical protein